MTRLVGETLLDRYFLRELAGSGGMADVYLAWDNLRSSKMAIKVLRRDLAASPRFYQMFKQEAGYLRKLEHPSIVRLYEFEKDGEIAFIVMDWIEGSNLRQTIVDRKKPFTLEEVGFVLEPVCSALNYAHQKKVYHCDVKPSNILLHQDGRVLLTDFGVARLASEKVGGGTPPYMAPEQFSGGDVSPRSDVYALGITMYEMLSGGEIPFRGESVGSQGTTTRERIGWEHLHLPLPSLRNFNGTLPESIELLIRTALDKDPELRYQSMLDLRQAFEHARQESGRGGSKSQTILQLISPKVSPPSKTSAFGAMEAPPVKPRIDSSKVVSRPSNRPAHSPPRFPTTTRITGLLKTILSPKPIKHPRAPVKRVTPRSGLKKSKGYLFGRSGDWAQKPIPISGGNLTIGRGSQNILRLSESSVSREHATILVTRQGTFIRDENSSLGTLINGQRITGPTRLKHGDVIQIGHYQVFEYLER